MRYKMKRTIKRRIFTVNLLTILLLLVITAVVFNLVARSYLEQDTIKQLKGIATRAENVMHVRLPYPYIYNKNTDELIKTYANLLLAIKGPSSTINADYAFIDEKDNILTPFEGFEDKPTLSDIRLIRKILSLREIKDSDEVTIREKDMEYAAVIKPIRQVSGKKIGTLMIYSSLDKIDEMQKTMTVILLAILLIAAIIVIILSSYLSKEISAPLSTLGKHIKTLSELKFSNTLFVPADNEIQELVQNINTMAEKLDTHNKSQKLFLQNASHEFRTPIMSIQSHAEGILYGVVESPEAAQIILDESKRLTHLVEELLYLSRLDAIEEIYNQEEIDVTVLLKATCLRMSTIADNSHVGVNINLCDEHLFVNGDSEKLERCFSNIINNCIRYAQNKINIEMAQADGSAIIKISDDGPGFNKNEESEIFKRFYKGKKGNTGLGLAISKSIIEKHHGTIAAHNLSTGAEFIINIPQALKRIN
jgi:signal transduction histidine kinase